MPETSQDIRQTLIESNQEYRNLFEEHSRCESKLQLLLRKSYWKVEDMDEEVALKRFKLYLKDMMSLIVARETKGFGDH
ncbi:MAG TPA: hypothetical protein VGD60_16835 [Candidatus Acidoferrales bacterium]